MEKGFSTQQYEDELGKKNRIIMALELKIQVLILKHGLEAIASGASDPVTVAKETIKEAWDHGLSL